MRKVYDKKGNLTEVVLTKGEKYDLMKRNNLLLRAKTNDSEIQKGKHTKITH